MQIEKKREETCERELVMIHVGDMGKSHGDVKHCKVREVKFEVKGFGEVEDR